MLKLYVMFGAVQLSAAYRDHGTMAQGRCVVSLSIPIEIVQAQHILLAAAPLGNPAPRT
jgi:hypothetical protein